LNKLHFNAFGDIKRKLKIFKFLRFVTIGNSLTEINEQHWSLLVIKYR